MLSEADVRKGPVRVVIVGGGVAALESLVALRSMAPLGLETVLVAPGAHFSYRPLQVGEPFGLGEGRRYDLATLCRQLDTELVRDEVVSVDAPGHSLHLGSGSDLHYDILLLAVGARAYPAFEHGVTFDRETAPADFDEVLSATGGGLAEHVAIVVPDGASWTLPAYELAMLTAGYFPGTKITLVTYEHAPLEAFGGTASNAVVDLVDAARITLRTSEHADVAAPTALRVGWDWLEASRIVALPLLGGPRMRGVPADARGFIPVDSHGRVTGVEDVYAAGDGTNLPVKQGGLATQMADAAAEHIAGRIDASIQVTPFRPILRGLLLTLDGPRYLRAELDDPDGTSAVSTEPLWWPPSKIASRWLAPYLERTHLKAEAGLVAGRA